MEVLYRYNANQKRETATADLCHIKASELPDKSKNFIYKSYLRSLQCDERNATMYREVFYANWTPIINRIVADGYVIMANDPDQCEDGSRQHHYGYLLWEPKLLIDAETGRDKLITVCHWLYVKEIFRKFGLGSKLLEEYKVTNKLMDEPILCSAENWNFRKYRQRLDLILNSKLLV
jgi:GNAT superfamily N-acetyltransferase